MAVVRKIMYKANGWWNSGCRKGLMLLVRYFNKMCEQRRGHPDFEPVGLSSPGWASRKR
ncbi:hypothetical protein [Thermanaeromonas toyohensis]|uniref:hypothetical protein n=1 Tax=Thermanaeromonas toyohensis TaxID=161154 RepID=UPI0012F4C6EE|nr:hypothetical protein [Thermanaeromonas toyohensis]